MSFSVTEIAMGEPRALIVGGSGFVGSALVPALRKHGYAVTVLNRGTRRVEGAEELRADRLDAAQMADISQRARACDVVIDTSAYSKRATEIAWAAFAAKTSHWIHLSSAAVYRETPGRCPRETDGIGGAGAWGEYGAGKTACDEFLLTGPEQVPVTVIRPPYLYGPGNDNDREAFVWSRALQGAPIIVPSDGSTRIQFLHVEDLASAIVASARHRPARSAVYNVAGPERPSIAEWVRLLCEIAHCPNRGVLAGSSGDQYSPRQYFPFRDYPCCVEVECICSETGWRPAYGLRDGFASTFETADRAALSARPVGSEIEQAIYSAIQRDRSQRMPNG